ncbi:hypothetical protein [Sphingobacterium daejeonense]|uniref:hypothetical protein n=1 Tax=Sphingobacterium daejeonense TaxID=371142 RepID=UPI0010C42758|nr:hypothetical protein [Sphingobacterium daejeonense]VTQ08368.1 Uncharacterised protein [Sphingobacterium daejeonense]
MKANEYLKRALQLFKKLQSESDLTKLEGILEVNIILAENNLHLNELNVARKHLDASYDVLKNYPNSNVFLFYYYPEGVYYEKMGKYQDAIHSFDKAIAFQSGRTENFYINRAKFAKFTTLKKIGKNNEAIAVMQDLLKSSTLLPNDRNNYSNLLAQTYSKVGNMKEAYNWSQKYIQVSDSLHSAGFKKDLLDLENKYQSAEKEKQITQLRAEKQAAELTQKKPEIMGLVIGCGCCGISLGILIPQQYP